MPLTLYKDQHCMVHAQSVVQHYIDLKQVVPSLWGPEDSWPWLSLGGPGSRISAWVSCPRIRATFQP